MRITVHLWNAQQGFSALTALWQQLKPLLIAGRRIEIEAREERRNDPQNRKLHACIADISRQVSWAGRRWDVTDWKRLLTSSWMRTRNEQALVLPALDGHGVEVLYRHTSDLTKSECAELLDFILAWGTEQGVEWSDPAYRSTEATETASPPQERSAPGRVPASTYME